MSWSWAHYSNPNHSTIYKSCVLSQVYLKLQKKDPCSFLRLTGTNMKIHIDPSLAAAAESPRTMWVLTSYPFLTAFISYVFKALTVSLLFNFSSFNSWNAPPPASSWDTVLHEVGNFFDFPGCLGMDSRTTWLIGSMLEHIWILYPNSSRLPTCR